MWRTAETCAHARRTSGGGTNCATADDHGGKCRGSGPREVSTVVLHDGSHPEQGREEGRRSSGRGAHRGGAAVAVRARRWRRRSVGEEGEVNVRPDRKKMTLASLTRAAAARLLPRGGSWFIRGSIPARSRARRRTGRRRQGQQFPAMVARQIKFRKVAKISERNGGIWGRRKLAAGGGRRS